MSGGEVSVTAVVGPKTVPTLPKQQPPIVSMFPVPQASKPSQGKPPIIQPPQGKPSVIQPSQGKPSVIQPPQAKPPSIQPEVQVKGTP